MDYIGALLRFDWVNQFTRTLCGTSGTTRIAHVCARASNNTRRKYRLPSLGCNEQNTHRRAPTGWSTCSLQPGDCRQDSLPVSCDAPAWTCAMRELSDMLRDAIADWITCLENRTPIAGVQQVLPRRATRAVSRAGRRGRTSLFQSRSMTFRWLVEPTGLVKCMRVKVDWCTQNSSIPGEY